MDYSTRLKIISQLTWHDFFDFVIADDPRFPKTKLYSFLHNIDASMETTCIDYEDGFHSNSEDQGVAYSGLFTEKELEELFASKEKLKKEEQQKIRFPNEGFISPQWGLNNENGLTVYIKIGLILDRDTDELIVVPFHETEYD